MEIIEGRFKKLNVLGEGTYGVVFKAIDLVTKDIVAIKKIKLEVTEDEGIPATTLREISILKKLNHPNIVKLREVLVNAKDTKIYLVFDYYEQDLR